ncbi:MAG: transcription termination factor Rho [Defluviitaleaceae bacterium]|nr:transcription termination factor Rho [Defluviitaleaceae bacterium]
MNLENMQLPELRDIAKANGIKNIIKYRKAELRELLIDLEKSKKSTKEPIAKSSTEQIPRKRGRPPKTQGSVEISQESICEFIAPDDKADEPLVTNEPPLPAENPIPPEPQPTQANYGYSETNGQRNVFTTRAERQNHMEQLASGEDGEGILEIMEEGGYGFLRTQNYLSGPKDIYISPSQIRRFNLRNGDKVRGSLRDAQNNDKFKAILLVKSVNGDLPGSVHRRPKFEDLIPVFPDSKLVLEHSQSCTATRIIDLMSPVGRGQRGMIVSPPKAGKTVLLKKIANALTLNHPDVHLIVLLIDERPEEVTDIQRSIQNKNADIVYSTFDETPEHHIKIAEVVMERARRMVEQGKDMVILMDSITRLARAYNLTMPPGGRTLSGGLDPAALHMPKKFFGAARNIDGGGSLTILATALVETGSRLDDMVFEEFKGTGNMELVLDRKLSERRIFPAIDINKSATRREDLLLTPTELEAMYALRRATGNTGTAELTEEITNMLLKTRSNQEFIHGLKALKGLKFQ